MAAAAPPVTPAQPPAPLSGDALHAAIDAKAANNVQLSVRERDLMVKLYYLFRDDIVGALSTDSDDLNAMFWIGFVADMMRVAKTFKREGAQKKEMIMETLHIIIEHDVPEDHRDEVKLLVDTFAPPAIDMAVAFWHKVAPGLKHALTCGCCRKKSAAK